METRIKRINGYWDINHWGLPERSCDSRTKDRFYKGIHNKERPIGVTEEYFDSIAIIHQPKRGYGFRPIILSEFRVISQDTHRVNVFYEGVCLGIEMARHSEMYSVHMIQVGRWHIKKMTCNRVDWGCRVFHLKELLEIRKAMHEYYTLKELGIAQ